MKLHVNTDEPFGIEWLQFTFDRIRKAGWNPQGELLWGYFFVDPCVEKLERLGQHLESFGYRFVEIFEVERDEKPSGEYMLHVENVEIQSQATLAKRNVELARLAAEFEAQAYDGWDVGKVE